MCSALHVRQFFATRDKLLYMYENIDSFTKTDPALFSFNITQMRKLLEDSYHTLRRHHFMLCLQRSIEKHYCEFMEKIQPFEYILHEKLLASHGYGVAVSLDYIRRSSSCFRDDLCFNANETESNEPYESPFCTISTRPLRKPSCLSDPRSLPGSLSTVYKASNDIPVPQQKPAEAHRSPHQCKYARPVKPCTLCSDCHRLWHCPKFRDLTVFERLAYVNSHNLCHNCFLNTHTTDKCGKNARCFVEGCNEKHSMWIHVDPPEYRDANTESHPSSQGDMSYDCSEQGSLSHTLVSHADCDTSLSQSTVRSAPVTSLSHTCTMSNEDKDTQITEAEDDQPDQNKKSPSVRDSHSVDKFCSFTDFDGIVKSIDILKESLLSFTEAVEKCTRNIPEIVMSDYPTHLSSHCENKSQSICMENASTMTNTSDLRMFTNHDNFTIKPADLKDQTFMSQNDSGFIHSIQNMFVEDWFT